jgi:hypothetical protein
MTRGQIADGLSLLVLQLANDADVPDGWADYEWAYVKGIASGEILRLRARLFPVELPDTSTPRQV